MEDRLRFESLISDLSAGFVNISPVEVEGEINKCLQRITEFFDADRCSLGLFSEDGTQLVRAFEYHLEGVEPAPVSLSNDQLPWYMAQLTQGKLVVINRLEDLPAEAEAERRLCLAKSMKSILSIPMVSERGTLGSCALVSVRAERALAGRSRQAITANHGRFCQCPGTPSVVSGTTECGTGVPHDSRLYI